MGTYSLYPGPKSRSMSNASTAVNNSPNDSPDDSPNESPSPPDSDETHSPTTPPGHHPDYPPLSPWSTGRTATGNGHRNGNANGNGNGNGNMSIPEKSPARPHRSRTLSASTARAPTARLGAIDERSANIAPDLPLRNPSRRHQMGSRLFHMAFPVNLVSRGPPPPFLDDVKGPRGEKFEDVRANVRNGKQRKCGEGLRRLICICLIVLIVLAVTAIGVIVGLTRRHHSAPVIPHNGPNTHGFPLGSYSIDTVLSNVSTACSPNAATWRCYPYQTYDQSATGSESTQNWIISPNENNNFTYTISSTDNPFSIVFTNVSLTLHNANSSDEAYVFSVPLQKIVIPSAALTTDGSATQCFFNNTILTASLYTKKPKTYSSSSTSTTTGNFQPWPNAVFVEQSIHGGSGVPDCYKVANGVIGEKVDVGTVQSGADCSCEYLNYGT